MEKQVTVLRVEIRFNGRKAWVFVRCDRNPELVGLPTQFCVPERAADCPVGAEYRTEFTVPGA